MSPVIMALLKNWRLALLAVVLAALMAWGGWGEWRVHGYEAAIAAAKLQAATDKASAEASARATEQRLNAINRSITDELTKARDARDSAAHNASERLRQLAEVRTANAATEAALAQCRAYAGPAVRVIPDATRESLIDLARDADAVSDQLRACQAYISDVVQP